MNVRILLLLGFVIALYFAGRSVVSRLKALIAGEEGLSLTVYQDSGGRWTVGYGHLIQPGEPYFPYGSIRDISQAEADALFNRDTAIAQNAVASYVKVPLTDNQRAALISFAYNVGAGAFAGSTLLRKLNSGDYAGAAAEFPRWNLDNGVVVEGLVTRRAQEQSLFLA